MTKTTYTIAWNTGDYRWDSYPEIVTYDSLEEVIGELDLDDRQIAKLLEEEELMDEDEVLWKVSINEE